MANQNASNVAITGGTIAGVTASLSTPLAVTSGGTGQNALSAHNVLIGEGSSAVGFVAPGASGTLLASTGTGADPSFQSAATLGLAVTSGTLAQFAPTTSAQLASIVSDETGSGSLVFGTAPTISNLNATGTPTAPTATAGTSTTQIATTAFVQAAAGSGRLLNVQVFTSSGTYTPTAGASSAVIECVGAGGGGGGVGATSSTQVAVSGGGGSGAFGRARVTSLSSQTVTIGAAGGGGAAGANAGSAGGQTSIGTWLVCPGGAGGPAGTAQTLTNAQALAGIAAGGAIATTSVTSIFLSRGSASTFGISVYNTGGGVSGGGASSIFGGGGQASSGGANNASGFGAGGGGAANNISSSALGGGSGTAGLIIVYEFS
ncbi:hypothetical protein [Paraburkholderia sp. BL25I1N1]|uniref:hypothetical protein n=1 Tax=Paraburkholderia sp. BL25I1N1 TaxID=1938804 RepID=UPI000D0779E2|nr:hypothetical protein [Paraburkholderia sp. BL25I1N1]PRY07063.1 hypothetical protein B0G73_105205 [Paraburkholderia sp. BL25I1N1]